MFLPDNEQKTNTTGAKVGFEISLEYQLAKLLWCSETFESNFYKDRDVNDLEDHTYFTLDNLINNAATLIEYYYSNVIYSLIGTALEAPKKIEFRSFDKNNYLVRKAKIFKEFKIGELTHSDDDARKKHAAYCNRQFDIYLDFILNGKYDLLFEINNYVKHNGRLYGFWLKRLSQRSDFYKYHFINFEEQHSFLLKNNTIRKLLLLDYDEFEEKGVSNYLNKKSYELLGRHGTFIYFKEEDWVFVKGLKRVGITTLSLITKIHQLSLDILNHLITSKPGQTSVIKKLEFLKDRFEEQMGKLQVMQNR